MRRRNGRQHIAKAGGQRLAAELRGQDLGRVLVVPIDGGKRSHKALIANALGDILLDTFEFSNDLAGALEFHQQVQKAAKQTQSVNILVGLEPTGHYLENFVEGLLERHYEVRELNPLAVKCEREAGLTWCKTDDLDLCAIGQLVLNGQGRAAGKTEALYYNLRQAGRARRSSVRRRASVEQQIHGYMDRLFPGLLTAEVLGDPFGAVCLAFMTHYGSACRVKRAGKARLSRWLTQSGVRQAEETSAALMKLGAGCLLLPPCAEEALSEAVRFRVEEHRCLSKQIRHWEEKLAEYLIETPGIWLLTIREIGVPSAAEYLGEVGALRLYEGAGNIIGRAGLVSRKRQSASSSWQGGITKLGHARLRYCLGVIGRNLIRRNTYFAAFYRRLVEQSGKNPRAAITAVACKFVRVSWARMKLKGSFVPPAGEDLNQDIEKKLGEFLQTIGAGQLFQSKLGPRLRQVLEAGGYKRPQPIPRERASVRIPTRVRAKCPSQATPLPEDVAFGAAIPNCRQSVGTLAHIGEILRTHPVLQEAIKRQGGSHEVIGKRAGPTSKEGPVRGRACSCTFMGEIPVR